MRTIVSDIKWKINEKNMEVIPKIIKIPFGTASGKISDYISDNRADAKDLPETIEIPAGIPVYEISDYILDLTGVDQESFTISIKDT